MLLLERFDCDLAWVGLRGFGMGSRVLVKGLLKWLRLI